MQKRANGNHTFWLLTSIEGLLSLGYLAWLMASSGGLLSLRQPGSPAYRASPAAWPFRCIHLPAQLGR